MFSTSNCQRGARRRKLISNLKAQECVRCSRAWGRDRSWDVRAGMDAPRCPVEVPAPAWEAAEPVSQVEHLGTVLYGTFGTYLGTFNVVPVRGHQCKRPGCGLLKVWLKIFNFFFFFFCLLWSCRSPEKKKKQLLFVTLYRHSSLEVVLFTKPWYIPSLSFKALFIYRCCVIRRLEREIKCGLRQSR